MSLGACFVCCSHNDETWTSATNSAPGALLAHGEPTSPYLLQAPRFRLEDTKAVAAAAPTLKFSIIGIANYAERALIVGVHEGVLKGGGRMIAISSDAQGKISGMIQVRDVIAS